MSSNLKKSEALHYHEFPTPGKIEVTPTKKHATQRDLSLAYSPGVAEPCLEIEKNPDDVYKYTAKGNLVAVISNGTAVLGLGDIGAMAGKPVMEGKGLLFKIMADIDVFDIEVDTHDIDKFIETVKNIAPTFGGINLEDIKAPEAFEIERRLKEELNIPVMHDDQHGTAIISAAALINALELTGKKIEEAIVVVSGAGAAAISCSKLYKKLGIKSENIIMCDSKGVIRKDRDNLSVQKAEFATAKDFHTIEEAMVGSDVFLGLSKGGLVSPKMLQSMAKNPIVFALANPDPEITYPDAMNSRSDIIMGTGRSDYPNQVNNILGFPYIFRGALDVRATGINEEMKLAAVKSLAQLTREPVTEQVKKTYNLKNLEFSKDYIIPKPFDARLITEIPPAVAKAAIDSGIAKKPITDWEAYKETLAARLGTGNKLMRMIMNRAKTDPKRVVFAEADSYNVLKAAQICYDEGFAKPILLGDKKAIKKLMKQINFEIKIPIIDSKSKSETKRRNKFAVKYFNKCKRKGVTYSGAQKWMRERNYFAAMMVNEGQADALITGYSRNYPSIVKPMIELIGKEKGIDRIAATNLMLTKRGPLFFSDTAININPTSKELAKIAVMTAKTMSFFGLKPNMAMLSYSNFGSTRNEETKKVAEAVNYMHRYHSDIDIDGEVQADFALTSSLLKEKFPFSKLADKPVNALIFPTLDAANISYKILKGLDKTESVGPIVMGLKKPAHLIQFGSTVDEIVNMTCIAVVDAQEKENNKA